MFGYVRVANHGCPMGLACTGAKISSTAPGPDAVIWTRTHILFVSWSESALTTNETGDAIQLTSRTRKKSVANREQKGNREKKKPKKDKAKPVPQVSTFSVGSSAYKNAGKKK